MHCSVVLVLVRVKFDFWTWSCSLVHFRGESAFVGVLGVTPIIFF